MYNILAYLGNISSGFKLPIVFISDEAYLTSKYLRNNFKHFICISLGNNDRLKTYLNRNNTSYFEYNKYIMEIKL